MEDALNQVETILVNADKFVRDLQANRDYSDEYKQREIPAHVQNARANAIAVAQKALSEATEGVQVAQAAHDKEFASWREAVPPDRQMVAYRQVDALEHAREIEVVQRFVDDAIQARDVASLRAFVTTAPKLLNKTGQTGAPYGSLDIHHLITRSNEALGNFEPETLKQARTGLQTAQQREQNLRRGIVSLNERYARHTGGNGPLVQERTVNRQFERDGKTRTVITSENWF